MKSAQPNETLVGIEWTDHLAQEIHQNLERIKLFELIPENFFGSRLEGYGGILKRLRDNNIPTLVHAVEISVGSDQPLREKHFEQVLRVADAVPTVNVSDHLCMTEADGIEIGQLTPIPWTQRGIDVVCRNIDFIQSKIDVPFSIENVTNRFEIPNNEFTETEFINQILQKTGCNLLLDVTNVYTNSVNFKYDPYQWIDEINLAAVDTIHLAGGYYDDEGSLVDAHSRPVPDPVWDLFRYVCTKIRPPMTIVEWTEEVPPIQDLFDDVDKAEKVLAETDLAMRNSSEAQPSVAATPQGGF